MLKLTSHYYKKDEHPTLKGLVVFAEGKLKNAEGKMRDVFIILDEKDLFYSVLKKFNYLETKKQAERE